MRSHLFLLLILILASCGNNKEKENLKKTGYQFLNDEVLAVQCPCKLKRDKKMESNMDSNKKMRLKAYSCFYTNYSVRGAFQYTVCIIPNKKKLSDEEIRKTISDQLEVYSDLNISHFSRAVINGHQSAIYHNEFVSNSFIVTEENLYNLGVMELQGNKLNRDSMNRAFIKSFHQFN